MEGGTKQTGRKKGRTAKGGKEGIFRKEERKGESQVIRKECLEREKRY